MINITNLNKFYKTRRHVHHALKDVSITLPDRGLVFVLGKSGSGKSTLLNLIGGLDNPSSGSIVVDGNDISGYGEKQFTDYRNSSIGFIFQDHHLIDDLTVYENIKLVLDLRHVKDTGLIASSLASVGLGGYGERYPRELSGGERQRVAIARAIVKRPRIILADEPTGNLDGRNAAEVMKILKELSKECLVLTVSHNTAEVYANADRILELSDGSITSDTTRNRDYPNEATLVADTVVCPGDRVMSEDDEKYINTALSQGKMKRLAVRRDKFSDTESVEHEERNVIFTKTRLRPSRVIALSAAFLKSKVGRIFSVALPLSLILFVILLSQAYINFDGNRIIADRMKASGQNAIVLSKEVSLDGINKNARRYHGVVNDDDVKAFMDTGFEGKTYPILSVSVPVTSHTNSAGIKSTYFSYGVAATESLGTVIVDEDFFVNKLGKLEYLARTRNFDPLGVVITDYLADMIVMTNPRYKDKGYMDLVGTYVPDESGVGEVTINGVIRTDYKERYKELIDRVIEKEETDISVLYNDEEFQRVSSELYSFLAYSYSFNPNYVSDYLASERDTYVWSHKLTFDGKESTYNIPGGVAKYDPALNMTGGQVQMSIEMYNATFGTAYTVETADTFTPHKVKLGQYAYYDEENASPMLDAEVEITRIYEGKGLYVSGDLMDTMKKHHIRQTGIYFEGLSCLSDILDVADERGFIQDSIIIEGILTLHRCVRLFTFIFRLVNVVLCAAVVFIFISFSTKMIHDKLHEIGILKALGTDKGTINVIFGIQIGLIAVLTCLISVVGYYFLVEPANTLFVVSLREMVPSQLVLDLDVLVFIPKLVVENVILIAILSAVSLIVPMTKIGKIQPVKIINSRD